MVFFFFFSFFWTPMSTKFWGFSCFLIRNIFGLLVVYFTHLAPHMHFSCLIHALHIATSCAHLYYLSHVLVYILFPYPQHVMFYFMLCSIVFLTCFVFCLSFIFSFILYPSCIITLVHIFFSFPPSSLSICLFMTKRGRVYQRVYRRVLSFLYDSCAYSKGEKFYFLCTILGGESLRGDAYTKGRRHFLLRKPCFVLFYSMLVFLFSMLYCSHLIVFMCWTYIHPYAIVLYWLHVRMIICFAM